jgi:hypothetical protein
MSRSSTLASDGAAVGHPQQACVLLGVERARCAARDFGAAHVVDVVGAELGGQRAQRGEVLGDRRRRAAGVLELLAVGAHRRACERLGPGVGSDEGAGDAGVGAPRQRRRLVTGDVVRELGEQTGVNELSDERRGGGG